MSLMRQSIERNTVLHYHEVLSEVTKIFFDIDIKVPTETLKNTNVLKYCEDRLDDNGENYATSHRKYYQSALE